MIYVKFEISKSETRCFSRFLNIPRKFLEITNIDKTKSPNRDEELRPEFNIFMKQDGISYLEQRKIKLVIKTKEN